MRAIIFLDVDGVLINEPRYHQLPIPVPVPGAWETPDPACIEALNKLVEQSGASIVVSSCWRVGRTVQELKELLESWGVKGDVIARTGESRNARGMEIGEWLLENPESTAAPIVILDDSNDMLLLTEYLVRTDFKTGLLPTHVGHAMEVLRKQGWK